jgi:hypothetical protein
MQVNGVSTASVTTTPAAITPPKPEATTTPTVTKSAAIQPKHDTVELTGAALAKSLKLSGQNVAQIALKMGLDAKTINSYLSIKVATPTPAPALQAKQAATATAQPYSPAEEAKEPAKEKATETAQGKK